jgi:hypothetical protein
VEVSNVSYRKPPLKKLPTPPATTAQHEPGLVRDIVEKTAGVISAAVRLPNSVVAGLTVGGYQGGRKGHHEEFTIKPESVAVGVTVANAATSVAKGAALGFLTLGPAGAATFAVKEGAESSLNLYLFVKGGSAKDVGEEMAQAIDGKVEAGGGAIKGAWKGAVAGTVSGTKAGAKAGFQEGRGTASGVLEGLKEIPREFEGAGELRGPLWKRALATAAGALSAALAAPAGLVLALMKGKQGDKVVSTGGRLAASAVGGALMGGLAGAALGPVGVVVGAGTGAVAGLLGPSSKKSFDAHLTSSLRRAQADDGDMGSEVANNRRDLVQKVVTGALSGTRQGWDAGKELLQPS